MKTLVKTFVRYQQWRLQRRLWRLIRFLDVLRPVSQTAMVIKKKEEEEEKTQEVLEEEGEQEERGGG